SAPPWRLLYAAKLAIGGRARVAPQVGVRSQGQAREIRNGGPLPTSDSREGARRGGWLGRREDANRSVAGCHVRIRARPRTTPDAPYRPAPLRRGSGSAGFIEGPLPFAAVARASATLEEEAPA